MNQDYRLEAFAKRIEAIEQRNQRVEADKAWETSLTRIATVSVLTYICAAAFLCLLHVDNFWLSALVPSGGFFLSAQSLPAIKRRWLARRNNRLAEFKPRPVASEEPALQVTSIQGHLVHRAPK